MLITERLGINELFAFRLPPTRSYCSCDGGSDGSDGSGGGGGGGGDNGDDGSDAGSDGTAAGLN